MSLEPEEGHKTQKWTSRDPWSQAKHNAATLPPLPDPQVEQHMAEHASIAAAVKARRAEYIRKKSIKIKIGSWNVASMSGAEKDLAGWFVKGLGIRGLSQDASHLSFMDDADPSSSSSDETNIESVEDQERRASKRHTTLPKHDEPSVASEDDVGLYALGLQEVIDITSVTEAFRPYYDPNPAKKWKHALKKALPAGYLKVAELQLLGLLILVYAHPHVAPFVSSVDCASVGTGALGYMGNKGATSVRIVLGGTTRILFVNCHLAAGADKPALDRRIWDTSQILSRTRFTPANYDGDMIEELQEQIGDEDFAFWFGDLNYRLDGIPGEDVRRLLLLHTRNEYDILNKSKRKIDSELGYVESSSSDYTSVPNPHDNVGPVEKSATESTVDPPLNPKDDPASLYTTIQALLAHDQLRIQQKLGKAFHEGWREGDITFLPTYKYDIGSVGMFDSGEKKRSPSWCDRILYRSRSDKQAFDERITRENEARKRDEELKSRGLDKAAADQEVLFDYNPEIDGTDDYDEYDEGEVVSDDLRPEQTIVKPEDNIKLEDYISHQRVLSSDHKPLSAVFELTYDAVLPELKTKIHAEVTREFDRNENETRPSVTVVVENSSNHSSNADKRADSTELNDIDFDQIRYGIPQTHTITIANTSPIATTFAFIDRPVEEGQITGPAPKWLSIHVNHDGQSEPSDKTDLGVSTSFKLQPGDIATADLTVLVSNLELVHELNEGLTSLDDILVLRVLNGRDHFLRVKGDWLQSSLGRTLKELVQVSEGVRHLLKGDGINPPIFRVPSSPSHHSAPRELFTLTETLPGFVERAAADWDMLHEGEDAPWTIDPLWPFQIPEIQSSHPENHMIEVTTVLEALDTATPIEDHLDSTLSPIRRAELVATALVLFLASLRDGIIEPSCFAVIQEKMVDMEKTKPSPDAGDLQEMVMEVLSTRPIHSVSFTFITVMLTRLISELSADTADPAKSPQSPRVQFRDRSSTEVSEASSESTAPETVQSPKSRLAFLTTLPIRRAGTLGSLSGSTTPTSATPQTQVERKQKYLAAYVDKFAPIILRAEQDKTTSKGKEKKTLDSRKRRILEAFLTAPSSSHP